MRQITSEHLRRLTEIESKVPYNESPPLGQVSFDTISRSSPVLLSAPHGARTYRNTSTEEWHEEDEYTASMALLLGELCQVSAIATVARNDNFDPNYHRECPYKRELRELIEQQDIRYVLDLHGAALESETLDPNQTIDLGFRSEEPEERSMDEIHVQKLESYLQAQVDHCDPTCFVIGRNHFAAKGGEISEPITTFVYNLKTKNRVQAIQIEMKPQVRILERLPSASLFKSEGDYSANPACVRYMLQALANFIQYLADFQSA